MPNRKLTRRKLLQGAAALGGAAFATRVLAAGPMPTMRRTASAPQARASATSNGSVMKSLRRIGRSLAARAALTCSGRPPKPAM